MSGRWRPDLESARVDESLSLVVAWKERKQVEGRLIRTAAPVGEALRDACRSTLASLTEFHGVDYGPDAHIEVGEFMAVPRHIVQEESLHVLDLLGRASALETLDPRDIPTKLWFYAAVVGDDEEHRVAFIRKTDPHFVARPGWVLATLGETLSEVERPVFVLEDRFDLLVLRDGLVVLNATPFETLFRGAPELGERIPVWARAVIDHVPMAPNSAKILVDAARRNSRFARRLRAIFEQGHLKTVSLAQLRAEARAQGLDDAALFKSGKLVIDENTDVDTLLRLLNEDLFTGGLSGRKFAADRKRVR